MKYAVLTALLFWANISAQALTPVSNSNLLPHQIDVVSNRLASKSLSELAVIAMKLQMECQQRNNQDVCGGVRNILAVLETRLASLPPSKHDSSRAFVKGLMDGVKEANAKVTLPQ